MTRLRALWLLRTIAHNDGIVRDDISSLRSKSDDAISGGERRCVESRVVDTENPARNRHATHRPLDEPRRRLPTFGVGHGRVQRKQQPQPLGHRC